MARANRWSMSDRQKFLLGAMMVFGVFLAVFGAGLANLPISGLGVAFALVGPALVTLARVRGGKEYVHGTAQVQEVSAPPPVGHFGRAEFHLIVNARGVNAVPVQVRDAAVPTSKWPEVGATLPVLVAVDDPRRVNIRWNEVLTHRQAAEDILGYAEDSTEPVDPPVISTAPPPVAGLVRRPRPRPRPGAADEGPRTAPVPGDSPTTLAPGAGTLSPATPASQATPAGFASPADPSAAISPNGTASPSGTADAAALAVMPLTDLTEPGSQRPASTADDLPVRVPAPRPQMSALGSVPQTAATSPAEPSPAATSPAATSPAEAAQLDLTPAEFDRSGFERSGFERPQARREQPKPTNGRRAAGPTLEFILRESEPKRPLPTQIEFSDEIEWHAPDSGAVAHFLPTGPPAPSPLAPSPLAPSPLAPTPLAPSRLVTPTGTVSGVNGVSVTLIVADLQRSRRFYRDTLGMDEVDSSAQTSVLAFGDAGVMLRQVADMAPIDRRVMHLNLEVADVQQAYERLQALGVEFVHKPRVAAQGAQLDLCSAMFRDPDGHAITLMRWEIRR